MDRSLTERQQRFMDALFSEANGNITNAKIIAGYSTKTNNQDQIGKKLIPTASNI